MKLYDKEGNEVEAIACKYPAMGNGTWDNTSILINDIIVETKYDTTWGRYAYFIFNGRCYKISTFYIDYDGCQFRDALYTKKFTKVDKTEEFNAEFVRTFRKWLNVKYNNPDSNEEIWNEYFVDNWFIEKSKILTLNKLLKTIKNPDKISIKSMKILCRMTDWDDEEFLNFIQPKLV